MKNGTNKKKTYVLLPSLMAISFLFTSCNSNNLYKNYKDYGKGYQAAQKGKSAPSFWSSKTQKEGYKAGLTDIDSAQKPALIEFQYTEKEIKSLENRWDTFEDMVAAAFKGDCDAMFSIGLCYLYGGKGLPIDVSKANMFFAKAASLGHAPSLEKIRGIYHEQLNQDMSKGLLHQVYLNLIITMGHTEYTEQYHKTRTGLIENLGEKGKLLADEIERIAGEKLKRIYENLDELENRKKSQDSDAFFLIIHDITTMDHVYYDLQHWLSVAGIE